MLLPAVQMNCEEVRQVGALPVYVGVLTLTTRFFFAKQTLRVKAAACIPVSPGLLTTSNILSAYTNQENNTQF